MSATDHTLTDAEPDAGNLRYIAKHAYDGERCVWCGINIYDAAEDDPCVDHEPITYTSDATGLREAVEALAATLWLLVCHGDPTWNFNALPEYAADEHREQARAILASDWLANHDAEVARTAAKEAGERIAQAIEAQESCASPAGECYRDHEGCYVADSLRIAREEGRA